MNKSILTIALAVLAAIGAGTRASAQAPANVQAVDLGLPSGLYWASCNIGATTPEGYGDYYAWGETETKADYSWATYKYANGDYNKLTKYCSYNGNDGFTDDKTTLDPEDDAAHVNWGGDWRMPTRAEVDELLNNCTWTWTTQNGVNGYQVSSKTNGNSIFLPAAGCRDADLNNAGSVGYYWSASLNDYYPGNTWCIDFGSDYHDRGYNSRYFGLSVRPVREATAGPANVQATQGDTTGVTVTWDAVPGAVGYEITAESWDVAINRTVRTLTANEAQIKDTIPVRPALGRYTVKAVFADGTKSKASEPAIGWAVLETVRILGVSTRQPWNGKVDIDVEYKTMRSRFRELFRLENPPYPDSVSITARTADGELLPVRSLTKESPLDHGTYTVNRKTLQNGTALFSGSGRQRLVWDADADTAEVKAPNTIITITIADKGNIYAQTAASDTVDINTTRPYTIMIGKNDTLMPIPWAARWADEASTSLNMQDGSDFKLVAYTKYATVIDTIYRETMLADEEGTFIWKPDYGVTVLQGLFSNRATHAKTTYQSMVLRSPEIPPTVEHIPGALKVTWTVVAGCTYYQIVRRTLKPDGTRGAWKNMMGVSPSAGSGAYPDISVAPGTTYEYAVCPKYNDPMKYIDPDAVQGEGTYITAKPVVWAMGRMPIGIVLDAQAVGQNSIRLTWTHVPDAYRYDVYRDNGDGQYQKIGSVPYTEGITFTDTRVEPGRRYTYKAVALNWENNTLETSDPVDSYARLDALYLHNLQPRFPWNGLVDIFVAYRSAREVQTDGTPHFQLVAVSGKDTLAIKTLTLASDQTLDPSDFTLPADGTPQRLVWDARTDLGEHYYPNGLTITATCASVEPYQGKNTATAFEGGTISGNIANLDTRSVPEIILGMPTTIFADLGWVEGATRLEVFVNGSSVFSTPTEDNYSFSVGKEQLNIWGLNTLRLKSDNGIEQTAQIKYPDFVFTATQGNRDSIIVEWNSLSDVRAYSIRRRAANTADAFAEMALVQDTTRWADTSEETIIGEFEYTIMPLLASDEDAGPQPVAVVGWRAQDIARPVTVMPTENGTVTTDKPTARYGETVTLTITPAEGYAFDRLQVMDGETEIPVSTPTEGTYTFTMPAADVTVSASFKAETGILDATATDFAPHKIIRHGQIFILRGGKTYTPVGVEVGQMNGR